MYYKLIKTPIGWIGFYGDDIGLCRVQLPEKNKKETEKKILQFFKELIKTSTAPKWAPVLEKKIHDLFSSKKVDFSEIPINIKMTPFQSKVFDQLRTVPQGTVVTYKDLAIMIKSPQSSRAIGMAMGKNPIPIVIPCHRVVSSSKTSIGGFSAHKGTEMKIRLLQFEKADYGDRK